MQVTATDGKSRITLGRKMEKKYGRRFIIIPAKNEVILMPMPSKNPIKGLEELGKESGINRYSIKQIKKIVQKEAVNEALSNSR